MAKGDKIKIKARVDGDGTYVKALIKHPMESGRRKDAQSGELIPAHYIQEVTAVWKDKTVLSAYWGTGVSRNPFISFKFKGGVAGDDVTFSWVDNSGDSGSKTVKIE